MLFRSLFPPPLFASTSVFCFCFAFCPVSSSVTCREYKSQLLGWPPLCPDHYKSPALGASFPPTSANRALYCNGFLKRNTYNEIQGMTTILENHFTPNILLSSCFILGILLAPRDTCKDRLLNKYLCICNKCSEEV